jgi:NACHT domain
VTKLEADCPEWVAALFDESFLTKEAAPVFAAVVTRGRDASATELARRYVTSLGPSRTAQQSVRKTERVAGVALAAYTAEIRRHDVVSDVLDSKALDSIADRLADLVAASAAGRPTEGTLWDYIDWVIDRNLYLDSRGTFQTQRQVQLRLDKIFVSLDAVPVSGMAVSDKEVDDIHRPAEGERRATVDPDAEVRTKTEGRMGLQDVVTAHANAVVLGDPGAGKTTLLRHLALTNAMALNAAGVDGLGSTRVPILLRLASYATAEVWRTTSLTDFIGEYHRAADCPAEGLAQRLLQELDAGRCLVLLDGLDEIASVDDRIGVAERIEDFVRRHGRHGNRFVVTSRVAGYREAGLPGDFAHFRIQDMTPEQVRAFLEKWCIAVEDAETPDKSVTERRVVADREIAAIMAAYDASPGKHSADGVSVLCGGMV